MAESARPHIVVVASPGMGHLIPVLELSKRLLHRFAVTLITHSTARFSKPEQAILHHHHLPDGLTLISLPQIAEHLIPSDAADIVVIILTIFHTFPALRAVLQSLASSADPPVALVVDLLLVRAFDLAAEFRIAPYLFYTSSCMALSFSLHFPTLDATYSGEYEEMPEPLRLPGCPPLPGREFMEPTLERGSLAYNSFLSSAKRYGEARGILVNSFAELEPGAVESLQADPRFPPVYPVGPLVRTGSSEPDRAGVEWLQWLDAQPQRSVLFVSFGSAGELAGEQARELAWGLEMSGHRFLWAAKRLESALPYGFAERTKASGVGCVLTSWAPQAVVLGHVSTGGFLTHCGWNSALESIACGVPMIAWPLYAEQAMNAVLLEDGVGVALRAAARDGGGTAAGREEIARAIKRLMGGEDGEGRRVRERMKEVSALAARAVGDGVSSTSAWDEIAHEWERLGDMK